ncbi:MAG: hypothetical protein ABEK04_03375 [Candidatus Nanohalobium sp.]
MVWNPILGGVQKAGKSSNKGWGGDGIFNPIMGGEDNDVTTPGDQYGGEPSGKPWNPILGGKDDNTATKGDNPNIPLPDGSGSDGIKIPQNIQDLITPEIPEVQLPQVPQTQLPQIPQVPQITGIVKPLKDALNPFNELFSGLSDLAKTSIMAGAAVGAAYLLSKGGKK